MKTTISLESLQFHAFHGVLGQERNVGNSFTVDLRIDYPFEEAMETDNLDATASYADIYEITKQEMRQPSRLLEHVAGRIRNALLARYPEITGGQIRITKTKAPIPGIVGKASVEISW